MRAGPITADHIAEAIQYRSLERNLWMESLRLSGGRRCETWPGLVIALRCGRWYADVEEVGHATFAVAVLRGPLDREHGVR